MSADLNKLLETNSRAKAFFGALPDFVQGGVMLHASEINNEEDLHKCAESIYHEFD